jgi:hypothetical protein
VTEENESYIDKELVTRYDFAGTIKTKIASYINGHSWYKNILMTTQKKEMNGYWNLDPIREGFYKLL